MAEAQSAEKPGKGKGKRYDEAIDSLHTLPLEIMPVKTPGLKKALLIKNARLESVIELFNDSSAGSGQAWPRRICRALSTVTTRR